APVRGLSQAFTEGIVEGPRAIAIEADHRDVPIEVDVDAGQEVAFAVNPAKRIRLLEVEARQSPLEGGLYPLVHQVVAVGKQVRRSARLQHPHRNRRATVPEASGQRPAIASLDLD